MHTNLRVLRHAVQTTVHSVQSINLFDIYCSTQHSLKKNLGIGLLNLKRFLTMALHRPGAMGVAYTAVMLEKPLLS